MQMKHLLLLASLLTCMGAGAQQATFRNPVIAGDMADPTVIRVDNTYYATGTSSEWAPYYPLFRSKDLVNWRQIGHLFEQQPAWTRSSFWAPELFHRNGKTYAHCFEPGGCFDVCSAAHFRLPRTPGDRLGHCAGHRAPEIPA